MHNILGFEKGGQSRIARNLRHMLWLAGTTRVSYEKMKIDWPSVMWGSHIFTPIQTGYNITVGLNSWRAEKDYYRFIKR